MSGWNDRFVVNDGGPSQKRLPKAPKLRAMNGGVIKSVINSRPSLPSRRKHGGPPKSKVSLPQRQRNVLAAHASPQEQLLSPVLRKETSAPVMPSAVPAGHKDDSTSKMNRVTRASVSHDGVAVKLRSVGSPKVAPEPPAVTHSLIVDVGIDPISAAVYPESPCASLGDVSLGDDAQIFDDSDKPFPLCRLMKIGRGSSSIVYKSVLFPSLTVVAEKVVTITEKDKRKQLVRELKYLRALLAGEGNRSCSNIVRLLEAVNNPRDGTVSVCIELMDSGSLQDVIRVGGCKDETVLARIAFQVLCGLQFLHECRQVHRDIKPANILVNSAGFVKISDFGLSRELQTGHSLADSFIGTYNYMSPERIAGQPYTFSCDIWSFGLTILACSLGRYPYSTENGYWSLLHAIQQQPVPSPSEEVFSHNFRNFLSSSLQKDLSKRPSAETLLAHDVFTSMGFGQHATFINGTDSTIGSDGYDLDEFEDDIESANDADGLCLRQGQQGNGSGGVGGDVLAPVEEWILQHPLQNSVQYMPKSKDDSTEYSSDICSIDARRKPDTRFRGPAADDELPHYRHTIGLTDHFIKDFSDNIRRIAEMSIPPPGPYTTPSDLVVPGLHYKNSDVKELSFKIGVPEESLRSVIIAAVSFVADVDHIHGVVRSSEKLTSIPGSQRCKRPMSEVSTGDPGCELSTVTDSGVAGETDRKILSGDHGHCSDHAPSSVSHLKIDSSDIRGSLVVPEPCFVDTWSGPVAEATEEDMYDDDFVDTPVSDIDALGIEEETDVLVRDIAPQTIIQHQCGAVEVKDNALYSSLGSRSDQSGKGPLKDAEDTYELDEFDIEDLCESVERETEKRCSAICEDRPVDSSYVDDFEVYE